MSLQEKEKAYKLVGPKDRVIWCSRCRVPRLYHYIGEPARRPGIHWYACRKCGVGIYSPHEL